MNPTDNYTFAGSINPTSARIIRDLDTAWEASGRLADDGESAEAMHFGKLFARLFVRYPEVCKRTFDYLTEDEFRALEDSAAECDIASARGRIKDDYDAVRHDIVNRLRGEVGIGYDVIVSDGEGHWERYELMATSYVAAERAAERAAGMGYATRVTMRPDRLFLGVRLVDAGSDD
jgi:hypothetical protein